MSALSALPPPVRRGLQRLSRPIRRLSGATAAGRSVTVLPDDVFLVSYPRSGNTWLRFVLSNLVDSNHPVDFVNVERRAPDIHANSDRAMLRLPRPRFLKSHEYFDPRYRRVVLMVRDSRDVVASYYRYHLRVGAIPEGLTGPAYLQLFLDGALDDWGSWQTHAGGWLGARAGDSDFFLLRYEDMLAEPHLVGRRLCGFLGLDCSDALVRSALTMSERRRMQKLEQTQGPSSPVLASRHPEIAFIGEGTTAPPVDENDEYLRSDAARLETEARFARMMGELGYK